MTITESTPPPAQAVTHVTRRLLAARGALLGLATLGAMGAAPAPNPDAELLALSARYDELERKFIGLFGDGPDTFEAEAERDLQIDKIRVVQEPILDRMMELRAHTLEGVMARVRTMFLEDMQVAQRMHLHLAESTFVNERLHAVLMRDLAAHAGVDTRQHLAAKEGIEA